MSKIALFLTLTVLKNHLMISLFKNSLNMLALYPFQTNSKNHLEGRLQSKNSVNTKQFFDRRLPFQNVSRHQNLTFFSLFQVLERPDLTGLWAMFYWKWKTSIHPSSKSFQRLPMILFLSAYLNKLGS